MKNNRMDGCGRADGFTVVELLVVVTIIALLVALLVPAIGKARESAQLTQSQANLRNLAAACASYGAAWNDRQWTMCADDVGHYGDCCLPAYMNTTGGCPASAVLGYGGTCPPSNQVGLWGAWLGCGGNAVGGAHNWDVTWPFNFGGNGCSTKPGGFGSWRMANCQSFSNYVGGKFYDRTFYAPKDKILLNRAECAFERGDAFTLLTDLPDEVVYSSYCFSPAAMWSPDVLGSKGFKTPCSQSKGAWRCPSVSQASFPDAKTRMLEHHWLQNQQGGEYNGFFTLPEPWYFNQSYNSAPCTMFFDGHIAVMGVASAMNSDQQVFSQNESQTGVVNKGLWVRNIPIGPWNGMNGYYTTAAYDDQVNTSYHVFTTNGIQGRDFIGE